MAFDGKRGPGRFQWNRGGWFGGQIGSTLWLILLGGSLLMRGRSAGAALLALGLIPNLVGTWLWRHRRTRSPYSALQLLVAVAGACALVGLQVLSRSGLPPASLGLPSGFGLLLIYPGLMVLFHFRERAARKASS